jgi:hypothetical protein
VHRRTFLPLAFAALALAVAPAFAELAAEPPPPAPAQEPRAAEAFARLGESRFQNFGRTFTLAFSPDGKSLAAGSWDGRITWWDLATRRPLRYWEAHAGPVTALAVAPDGRAVVSAGKDREIRLWGTADGRLLRALAGPPERVTGLMFSPDGKRLASQDGKGVRLWDRSSGRPLSSFKGSHTPLFSADGSTLTLIWRGSRREPTPPEPALLRVDVATGKERERRILPPGPTARYSLSASGQWLVRTGPYALRWTDLASGREGRSPDKEKTAITGLAVAPDERLVVVARADQRIVVIELATGQVRCQFRRPGRTEVCLAVAPDGRLLASGGIDRTVLLWDLTGRMADGKVPPAALGAAELGRLWNDLDAPDGATAHRAVWRLTAGARDSVPFLAKQLAPPRPADPARIAMLIRDLGAGAFKARTRAFEELENLRDAAEPALRKKLTDSSPLEMRRRLETLLARIDVWWARQWRLVRAVEVLEHSARPEARQVLRRLADSAASPRLAGEVAAALRRLDRTAGIARQEAPPEP